MFDSLKKKFSSWFAKKEEKTEEALKEEPKVEEKKTVEPKAEVKKETKLEKTSQKTQSKKETKKEDKKEEKKSPPSKEKTQKKDELPQLKEESTPTEPAPPSQPQIPSQPKIKDKIEVKVEVEEVISKKDKKSKEEKPIIQVKEEIIQVISPTQEPESEKEQEQPKQGFFSRMFTKIAPSSSVKLTQEHIDEIFSELELTLLENNVALEVVDKIKENLNRDLLNIEVKKDQIEQTILQSLKQSILEVLIEPEDLQNQIKNAPGVFTIIFFGINGSGKTTSIAKLAYILKQQGISCVLAAADTFRAASIEQLETHGKRLDIHVIKHKYGSDPAAVAFDAKKYAEAHNIKVVLVDTAGRMYTKQNLIREMEKVIRVIKPNLKIFVGESITGNDAVDQAKTFSEAIGIDGIILSKADVDEKAGTILSVSYVTKKPIYFLGTGQEYENLTPFSKSTVLKNIGLE